MDLREQARRRVACLMMGLSLKEADRLPDDEFVALVEAWDKANGFGEGDTADTERETVLVNLDASLLDQVFGRMYYPRLCNPAPFRRI